MEYYVQNTDKNKEKAVEGLDRMMEEVKPGKQLNTGLVGRCWRGVWGSRGNISYFRD